MDFAAILKAEVDRKRKQVEDKNVLNVSYIILSTAKCYSLWLGVAIYFSS